MTCQELSDFVMAFLDAELPAAQQQVFQDHLGACPSCQNYLDSYQQTVSLGRSICRDPDDPVPEDVPEELVEAILAARTA